MAGEVGLFYCLARVPRSVRFFEPAHDFAALRPVRLRLQPDSDAAK
jgi:hypothetical protein